MTREDIIRMARGKANAILLDLIGKPEWDKGCTEQHLIEFSALVASAERERLTDAAMKAAEKAVDVAIALERDACAKLCEKFAEDMTVLAEWGASQCANAIRARGQS